MRLVYLDNAATTKTDPQVLAAMLPYFQKEYGNASEYHKLGREAKEAVAKARQKIAAFLGAESSEIYFTSCATEAINLSHKGLIESLRQDFGAKAVPHIITSQVEHKAVLETCRHLEKLGWAKVTYLDVDQYGQVSLESVRKAIKPETVLVSVMYVNNEVGTIEPIAAIGRLLKKLDHKVYFHCDATQAIGYLDCNVGRLGVDFLSLTGHKIYAPKGIGALYIRKGSPTLIRQQDGGDQERKLRAGTENVPYIVGLAKAIELVQVSRRKSAKLAKVRDALIRGVSKISGIKLTGHPVKRAPHIASFVVAGAEGEAIVLRLSELGIMAASGSACTSANLTASHVLTAMGFPPEISHGSIRFSLGKESELRDVKSVIRSLPAVVKDLRQMSPL